MDKFLDAFNLPKLKHLNGTITSNEIEVVISIPTKKSSGLIYSLLNSTTPLKKLTTLLKLF
jgi:hypothetical protein